MRLASFAAALCALFSLHALARPPVEAGNPKCSKAQQEIAAQLEKDLKKSAADHVKKNFTPKGSYLVTDYVYQNSSRESPC